MEPLDVKTELESFICISAGPIKRLHYISDSCSSPKTNPALSSVIIQLGNIHLQLAIHSVFLWRNNASKQEFLFPTNSQRRLPSASASLLINNQASHTNSLRQPAAHLRAPGHSPLLNAAWQHGGNLTDTSRPGASAPQGAAGSVWLERKVGRGEAKTQILTPVKVFMLCSAFWASRAAFLV